MIFGGVFGNGFQFICVSRSIVSYGLYLIYKVFVSVAEFGYWSTKKGSLSFGHRSVPIAHLFAMGDQLGIVLHVFKQINF